MLILFIIFFNGVFIINMLSFFLYLFIFFVICLICVFLFLICFKILLFDNLIINWFLFNSENFDIYIFFIILFVGDFIIFFFGVIIFLFKFFIFCLLYLNM